MFPFGMQMPGRNYEPGNYRYSINGQEKSPEIAPNITTAMYWEYDSRIGKRWNIDPVLKVWESPYACFYNNPLLYTDPYGLDGTGGGNGLTASQTVDAIKLARSVASREASENVKIDDWQSLAIKKELDAKILKYAKENDLGWREGLAFKRQVYLYHTLYFASFVTKVGTLSEEVGQYLYKNTLTDRQKIGITIYSLKLAETHLRKIKGTAAYYGAFLSTYILAKIPELKVGDSNPRVITFSPVNANKRISTYTAIGDDEGILSNVRGRIAKKGWYDVIIHGSENGQFFVVKNASNQTTRYMTASQVYTKMVENGYQQGTKIRLMSCWSGKLQEGVAQELSCLAQAEVVAPTTPTFNVFGVWQKADNGKFIIFKPK